LVFVPEEAWQTAVRRFKMKTEKRAVGGSGTGQSRMNTKPQVKVRVTHRFNGSPERVFDAWLDPNMIGRWMFRDEEVVRIALDPRLGGSFSFVVRRQGQEVDHVGEYFEIDRPRRLVFSWGIAQRPLPESSRVTIGVVPLETGSEVTLTHELHPDWADYASRTEAGWTRMLNALAATLDD
jgi:uncharacterized protein YndB with AHSA1/START domain